MTVVDEQTPQPMLPVLGDVWPVSAPATVQADEATRAEAEALRAEAQQDADRIRAAAEQDAERIRAEAEKTAQRIRTAAERDAAQARARAEEAAAKKAERKKRDLDTWAARAVIAGAVGLTASGEYSLALMVGFDKTVAWLLPFVIDIYVVQAFRRHRDVVPAIGLTIATNVVYHLAQAGLFGVAAGGAPKWWLIALVASIASLILWRIHLMIAPPRKRSRESRRESTTQVSPAPAPAARESASESPRESASETSRESASERPRESRRESAGESTGKTGESRRESASENSRPALTPATPKRESRTKPQAKRRESKPRERAAQVSAGSEIDREVNALVALMTERGGPDEVSLKDAERITGKSTATAARRLSAARSQFTQQLTKTTA